MDTLRLDSNWQPLDIVTWQRAMVLLCDEKVEVLEEYSDRVIHSAHNTYAMPAVIRFVKPVRKRLYKTRFSRRGIYDRDGGKCCYCNKKIELSDMTYDHVIPKSSGGLTNWTNIVTSCFACNQKKRNRTPKQANMVLARPPIKPTASWRSVRELFSWENGMPSEWQFYLPNSEPLDEQRNSFAS